MKVLSLTQHTIAVNGINFKIITTEDNIQFLDENGGELNWDNNLENQLEVYGLIEVLEGRTKQTVIAA